MGKNVTRPTVNCMEKAWVLTVKNKKAKTFENIVFLTADVKVAHEYIDRMRAEKVQSFVSLADTQRIKKYVNEGEVTKLMSTNLKAIFERKVPINAKVMFEEVLNAPMSRRSEVVIVPVTPTR